MKTMAASVPKTGSKKSVIVVDQETGEILEETIETNKYISNSKEQFVLMYTSSIDCYKELTGPAIKTYLYLVSLYSPGQLIGLNKAVKQQIQKYLSSKSLGTVSNCLTQLCRHGLLIKQKDSLGGYFINPRYVFKGNTSNRNKSLQSLINSGYKNA